MTNVTKPADSVGRRVESGRLETVDSLRGLAAFAVMWFHLTQGNPTFLPAGFLKSTGTHGWLGVEVFFVISGFILPYALHRAGYQAGDYLCFVWKRIIRLDPPYLACIALVIALNFASTLAPNFAGPPFQIELNYLLLHLGYLNGFFNSQWLNPVFWTLAIEFQFYLLVALLFPLLCHHRPAVRLVTCGIMAASAFLLPSGNMVFHYLFLFMLGIWAFHLKTGLLPGVMWQGVSLLGLAMGVWMTLGISVAMAGALTALVIVQGRFKAGWLLFLGQISYSLYLLHVPIGGRVINLGSRYADSFSAKAAVLFLAVVGCVTAAFVFHRCVELPAQRWASAIRYRAARGRPT